MIHAQEDLVTKIAKDRGIVRPKLMYRLTQGRLTLWLFEGSDQKRIWLETAE